MYKYPPTTNYQCSSSSSSWGSSPRGCTFPWQVWHVRWFLFVDCLSNNRFPAFLIHFKWKAFLMSFLVPRIRRLSMFSTFNWFTRLSLVYGLLWMCICKCVSEMSLGINVKAMIWKAYCNTVLNIQLRFCTILFHSTILSRALHALHSHIGHRALQSQTNIPFHAVFTGYPATLRRYNYSPRCP